MSGLKRFASCFLRGGLWIFPGTADTLLSKTDQLDLVAFLGEDCVTFGAMLRGSLRFIVTAESFRTALDGHFFFFLPFFRALDAAFIPAFVYGYFLPLTIGMAHLL